MTVVPDLDLARRLVAEQFPRWADLPLRELRPGGTDNAIFRLGPDLAVRLPRLAFAADHVAKEGRWLPVLARQLPLAVPTPLAAGEPSADYPWPWSVHRWLDGHPATPDRIVEPARAAVALGRFVAALQRADAAGAPVFGSHNGFRGQPLSERDEETVESIGKLADLYDPAVLTAVWQGALLAPVWTAEPVWLHGDLHPGNLLARHGELRAVIDFGLLAVGDPACDAMVGWTMFATDARAVFRAEVGVDDNTWTRGRGWALSFAATALAYYRDTDSPLDAISRHVLDEIVAEHLP